LRRATAQASVAELEAVWPAAPFALASVVDAVDAHAQLEPPSVLAVRSLHFQADTESCLPFARISAV
jgi:hypothetical protein